MMNRPGQAVGLMNNRNQMIRNQSGLLSDERRPYFAFGKGNGLFSRFLEDFFKRNSLFCGPPLAIFVFR